MAARKRSCVRHPKTTQERRASQQRGNTLKIEDYKVETRACRNFRNLPNAYDDIFPPWRKHVSWKKCRKQQWKLL